MTTRSYTNARIITADNVISGHLVVHDGVITEIDHGPCPMNDAHDCGGDYLAPGLVELHTDNLEGHLQPRPGVHWPKAAAVLAHDSELAGVGITTVFDALRVGSILSERVHGYDSYARDVADEIQLLSKAERLKINHLIHLRAEICSETLIDEIHQFGAEDGVRIISMMDHTPGQRQFRDISKFRQYLQGKQGMSSEAVEAHFEKLFDLQRQNGAKHTQIIIDHATKVGARLASHDDATDEDVANSIKAGATIAEFPTTIDAAKRCREANQAIIMGAPNLIRGGSHSGNVAARNLAEHGLLDILSSDYVPAALLMSAWKLANIIDDLAGAIATVTHNPAKAAGLVDRGILSPGMRADLIRFGVVSDTPQVREVLVSGRRVA
ncbi:MAG TPA: phosphonate metabolism protein PhnM [Alphaproteobacteria bacterium]|nr:phosphonate metabolism protein PhnM [Paracoccaceae bacterium]RCL81372.1 MAG: alpha-D-ribose 1-methylphosphonate 5-triphosphate diphosphatase [SAR116 cluster bacterium]RPH14044.1 MAG: alpha-D-ribose 1-methylphosphonate 5-triphosphate diphosphatase [Alphaproteobacteria bacterium TMED150]HBQ22521.1 phosphonate metabolism protein PhnM [Alphaproteobacteria bacterium]HCY47494.1 phosphonate metabolism protein PhnM [Alphaproteobacteria bacterium]|tara:strand:+ start:219 stop:1361 length:1143 start_codon:yes stop_codon:yes gene_type:complete